MLPNMFLFLRLFRRASLDLLTSGADDELEEDTWSIRVWRCGCNDRFDFAPLISPLRNWIEQTSRGRRPARRAQVAPGSILLAIPPTRLQEGTAVNRRCGSSDSPKCGGEGALVGEPRP